jgi:hypothetical protein
MTIKIIDNFQNGVALFMTAVVAIFFVSGIGVLGYQVLFFARNGIWLEIAVADLANFNRIQEKWIGIYKVLMWLPASTFLILMSFILMWIFIFIYEEIFDS